jgi:FMN-dependent NADH-azoreductase
MKALIVTYCPRGERSRTKLLADHARAALKNAGVIVEDLDLARDIPDLLTPERLSVYYRRNYMGENVSAGDAQPLSRMDQMTAQLIAADIVVLAYPMYNFSQPAIVKAWMDSVMQKGKTWDFTPDGYAGKMKGKKALVLSTSGGVYEGELAAMDHSLSLSKIAFGFMGYDTEVVTGAGINRFPEKEQAILDEARGRIGRIVERFVK